MRKFPVGATICVVISVIILCALGTWQIQRLHWKEALLTQLDAAYQLDAAHTPLTGAQIKAAAASDTLALRGTLTGHYLEPSLRITPRVYHDDLGFNIYTPLQLADGNVVLVNRGWIPQTMATIPPAPTGKIHATGLLRKPDRGNPFTPPNDPANNLWFKVDPAQIAALNHLPALSPYVLYVEATGPVAADAYPKPSDQKMELYNNHRSYAIFWFMMAGMMVFFYWLRFFSRYGVGSVISGAGNALPRGTVGTVSSAGTEDAGAAIGRDPSSRPPAAGS